jgi:hypothetical protein
MSSFFIVLTSNNGFECNLTRNYDKPFRLTGEWEVALTHLNFTEKLPPLFVFCDLLEYSNVNGSPMNFLDLVNPDCMTNSYPQYAKVARKRFSSININIRTLPETDDFKCDCKVYCVLRFRKV